MDEAASLPTVGSVLVAYPEDRNTAHCPPSTKLSGPHGGRRVIDTALCDRCSISGSFRGREM